MMNVEALVKTTLMHFRGSTVDSVARCRTKNFFKSCINDFLNSG